MELDKGFPFLPRDWSMIQHGQICSCCKSLAEQSPAMEPFEKTYAMIKPDALRAGKAEEICQLIEVHGFTIIAKQKLQVN